MQDTLNALWNVLRWRAKIMPPECLPLGHVRTFLQVVRSFVGRNTENVKAGYVDTACDLTAFKQEVRHPETGFPWALAAPIIAARHGWAF
jgi:hypothetical protein